MPIEANAQAILRVIPDLLFWVSRDGKFLGVHAPDPEALYVDRDKIVGAHISELLPPGVAEICEAKVREAIDNGPTYFEYALPMGDEVRHFEARVSPGESDALVIVRDVTDRKQLEEERERIRENLLTGQKLESMGLLAGGIAHDFNNLLTGIVGNASLLSMQVGDDPDGRRAVDEILLAADRAAALTRQILVFSGKGRFEKRPVDVSYRVEEIAPLVQTSVSSSIDMHLELATGLPAVEADPSQIQQVVLNLAINAAQAIGDKPGRISIRTSQVELHATELSSYDFGANVTPGTYVCLEVEDDGCGMDTQTRRRVLDPFFTTKSDGRGLGLAAVAGVVKGHEGALMIRSSPGVGSSFRVYLPTIPVEADDGIASAPPQQLEGTGVIMVVDDDEVIRQFAGSALRGFGYEVIEVANGEAAVAAFHERNGEVDCVVLDVMMPVMNGAQCLAVLRAADPQIPVILTSGYDEAEAARRITEPSYTSFLMKPFSSTDLAARVAAACRQR